MDSVLRAAIVYLIVLVLFRLTGKRTLAQVTTMDLVLLLIISEATQQALLGEDFSITNAALVIVTLILLDRIADLLKARFSVVGRITEGSPIVLVENGVPLTERLRKEHLNETDILAAARSSQGLTRMAEIRYAVLESSGGISIIPWRADDEVPAGRREGGQG